MEFFRFKCNRYHYKNCKNETFFLNKILVDGFGDDHMLRLVKPLRH